MAVLMITHDLHDSRQESALEEKIKNSFETWARLSHATFAIETRMTPHQVYHLLSPLLYKNDVLHIIALARPFHGQGPIEVNEWLEDCLP